MPSPYTIRIFVPNGDPDGVRIIDRMNWTGVCVFFPRSEWGSVKQRDEFTRPGVYILTGYSGEDGDDLPTVYIGQSDGVGGRIDDHIKKKAFWTHGMIFTSTSGGLNRAHATWLEYALVNRANRAGQCILDNNTAPTEPAMSEAEKADTQGFLKEILQILPLVGVRAFEIAKPVATPQSSSTEAANTRPSQELDTVVVPAQEDGFREVFLGENRWYAIRIAGGMIDKLKYIAAYQTAPTSAITHFAPIDRIEPYGDGGKYALIFSEPAQTIGPIAYADAPPGSMQSPRYASFSKLKEAKTIREVFG